MAVRGPEAALADILNACQSAYGANCPGDLTDAVCPGVRKILSELKQREAAMGLVTGNLSAIALKKLELAGLRDYFATGAFAEDGSTRTRLAKIASARALEAGMIGGAARISLIGDHMNDIEAARANGFQAIAVASGLTSADELARSKPDVLVQSLAELDPNLLV